MCCITNKLASWCSSEHVKERIHTVKNGVTSHEEVKDTDHATTASRLKNGAIIAGFVALAAIAVGALAAAVFFGAPFIAAAAGATVAAFALHAMVGAAVVAGLSLATMGLFLAGMCSEKAKAAEYEESLKPKTR